MKLLERIRGTFSRTSLLKISVPKPGDTLWVSRRENERYEVIWRRAMCLNHLNPIGDTVGPQLVYPTHRRADGFQLCSGFFCQSESRPLTPEEEQTIGCYESSNC